MIDEHSATWRAVQKFIDVELEDAINALVRDVDSDKQRGAIHVLERLAKLADANTEPVASDDYLI